MTVKFTNREAAWLYGVLFGMNWFNCDILKLSGDFTITTWQPCFSGKETNTQLIYDYTQNQWLTKEKGKPANNKLGDLFLIMRSFWQKYLLAKQQTI